MSELITKILSEDYVSATELFESRMRELAEMKTIEMKKQLQAEAVGGLTKDEIEARKKAGYRKAADVLGDPWDRKLPAIGSDKKKKKVRKKKIDEAGLGWGAQAAHGMSPDEQKQFRALLAIRRKARQPLSKTPKKPDYTNTAAGQIGRAHV